MIERDKEIRRWIDDNPKLVFTANVIADLIISNNGENQNSKSCYCIASRRLLTLANKKNLIGCKKLGVGLPNLYYSLDTGLPKQWQHQLVIAQFLGKLSVNRIKIIDFKLEQCFSKVRTDLVVDIEYNGARYTILVEVDRQGKSYNVQGYANLIQEIKSGVIKFHYPVVLVSIAERLTKSEDCKPLFIQLEDDKIESIQPLLWTLQGIKR